MMAATRPNSLYDNEKVELRNKQRFQVNAPNSPNISIESCSEGADEVFEIRNHQNRACSMQQQQHQTQTPDHIKKRRLQWSHSVGDFRSDEAKPEKLKANLGSKNGTMVLQLVLPSGSQNNNINSNHLENNNYLTASSIDEIFDAPATKRRNLNSVTSQQDIYSTLSNNEYYANHGFANELADYGRGFGLDSIPPQSPISTSYSEQHKSTPTEEKNQIFRKHLTSILSSMYALFIVTLGLVVYLSDVVIDNSPIAETFSLYLVIIDLVFILYLIIDIRLYMRKRAKYNDLLHQNVTEGIEMKESPTGDFQLNITLPEAARIVQQLDHHYCLSKDRHSANFYLKVGAAGFCVGHLIHSGLLLGYQIIFLTSDSESFYECATVTTLILDIIYPIYSFLLLYFIFKYSNVIINRHVALGRFGIMHCMSSSVCFWIWTILRETVDSLSHYQNTQLEEEEQDDDDDTKISATYFLSEDTNALPVALPLAGYSKAGAALLTNYINSSARQFSTLCSGNKGMGYIYENYSPYLYPFSVEYSILVVGVLFVIWQSIGKCKEKEEMSDNNRQCDSPEGNGDNLESNVVVHVDCHSANKGLFGGIVIMVVTVVSVILFFIAINNDKYKTVGILVNVVTSIIIILLMTVTGIFAYRQITKLDVNKGHMSLLDDLLLFICIPAYFLNGIFSIIPAVIYGNSLSISVVILEVIQVLIQTPLIIDGLRRSSNTRELRKKKPGRELLTFLVVCNVAMWITQTFEVKSHELKDQRYEFYGKELWTIIGHMCIPLMMFYRFHSSVCLVDIWKYAYEPSTH